MKRIVSLMLAMLIIFTGLPVSLIGTAEGTGEEYILPVGLTKIKANAFANNASVKTVIVPNNVTSIGSKAFANCTGLTEVVIPSRDIAIADDAFDGCSRDVVFYTYSDSDAWLWAMAHGYLVELLDEGSDFFVQFEQLLSHSGFNSSMLQSSTFASMCIIVRIKAGENRLPDISDYNPIDIVKSDTNLYYIQFATEGDAEDCHNMLLKLGHQAEPDRIGAENDMYAQGVTIAENWGTNDTMGFDVYAPFVAQRASSSSNVTIAVIDSGVNKSVWGGKFSDKAVSFVGGNAYTDSIRHGSKVASIINDCLGQNVKNVTLLPIKIINSSSDGSMRRTSVVIEGIKHAIKNGANIINLSLGWDVSEGTSPEMEYQIRQAISKGIHVVAAAGNGRGNVMFPASCDGVLAVSALTYSNAAGYSVNSRTGSAVDYTAPGIHLTTSAFPNIDLAGDTRGSASTSFAAPQISAALALIKLDPTAEGNAVSVLNKCCIDLADEGLPGIAYGKGLPQLQRRVVINATDIVLKNMAGGSIPEYLWLGSKEDNFLMNWEIKPSDATDNTVTVTSSDENVVSVNQYGNTHALISAENVGKAVVTITNGKISKTINLTVNQPVEKILLTGIQDELIIGRTLQLAAAVLPENANNKAVEWRSSDESVASVSESGLVTAKKAGQVTITCEAKDGRGASAKAGIKVVDIPDATSITVTANEKEIVNGAVTLKIGETLTLEAKILPEDAVQKVYYSVFPQGIVEVSESGVIKAVAPGTATVVASASSGANVTAGISITVVILPESIKVTAGKSVIDVGDTMLMTGEVMPANASDKTITWTSKNPAVATVNSATGLVTAVAPGSAEIEGKTANGKSASATITVRQPITIVFDANGGACDEKTRVAYSGYAIGALPAAERAHWQFSGWYTAKNGGTKVSADKTFTTNTTLYAQWTGLSFNVSFNVNGGECATASMSGKVGQKLGTLPAATRTGYTFKGWYTAKDGGNEITPDYIHSTTDALTLFAHWTEKPYTMTFNANGGKCSTPSKTGTVDIAIGSLPEATREGYTFDGWFSALTGGTQITEQYKHSTTTPITVYAHWTKKPYVMTFDPNGGKCTLTQMNCLVDTPVGELPTPTKDGYTFKGWYTKGDNSVNVTAAYQKTNADNVIVVARWEAKPYTITFDANKGTCTEKTRTAYVDSAIGALPNATRSYYTFDGWFTAAEGGTKVTADYSKKTDAALTLYAHWTPNSYTMKFNGNGGTAELTAKTGKVDQAIGDLPKASREYYTFAGWFTAASGGTAITNTYVHNTDKEITVYAQWKASPYTINFNANGGKVDPATKTANVGQQIGTLPTPTREYYTFLGWYKADGTTKVDSTFVQNTTAALALTAKWEPMAYTIQFVANGANVTMPDPSTIRGKVDTPIGTLPTASRPYYDFLYWKTTAGTKLTTSFVNKTTDTITAYAQWEPHTYTLYFNANGGQVTTSSRTCKVDTAIGSLPTPTRDYYVFDGWYSTSSGEGVRITEEWLNTTSNSATIYARWIAKPESGWVTRDQVPADAAVTDISWSYREATEATSSTMDGWVSDGSYWKQTGTGSTNYATFPSGFDKNHTLYTSYAKSPYTAFENETEKREVVNKSAGWIYWHWMYTVKYASGTTRAISSKKGTFNANGTSTGGFAYQYFYAFASTVNCPALDKYYCCSQNILSYNCKSVVQKLPTFNTDKANNKSGLGTDRFFRFAYSTSTYTDYTMTYKFYRDLNYQVTDPGNGANITNKVEYVKYRNK